MRSIDDKGVQPCLRFVTAVLITAICAPTADAALPLVCVSPQSSVGQPCPSPHVYAEVEEPGVCWVRSDTSSTGQTYRTAGAALEESMHAAEVALQEGAKCVLMTGPNQFEIWPATGMGYVVVGEYLSLASQGLGRATRYLETTWNGTPLRFAGRDAGGCTGDPNTQAWWLTGPIANRPVDAHTVSDGQGYVAAGGVVRFYSCPTSYQIRLSRRDGLPESPTTLDSVEPGNPSQLLARVYDQRNQLVPNVGIELTLAAINQSAGHHHGDDTAIARTGTLASNAGGAVVTDAGKTLTGNTGANGLQFDYNAPAVSGDVSIIATRCTDGKRCTQEGPRQVWVGVKGLEPLGNSQYFVPVGDTLNHFDNHYLTLEASSRINVLAALYRAKFPHYPLLHLNDASLERGGLFDVNSDWAPPHSEHCRGTEIDVRANDALGAIPSIASVRREFERLAAVVGAFAKFEIPKDKNKSPRNDLRHYHVRLMGGIPQCP